MMDTTFRKDDILTCAVCERRYKFNLWQRADAEQAAWARELFTKRHSLCGKKFLAGLTAGAQLAGTGRD